MELMEGLLSRRSVRQYTDQKVAAADITDIVKAGMYAPSARNQQVWEFVVITDKDKLAQFSSGLPSAPMAKTAAFAVAVCADPARGVAGILGTGLRGGNGKHAAGLSCERAGRRLGRHAPARRTRRRC